MFKRNIKKIDFNNKQILKRIIKTTEKVKIQLTELLEISFFIDCLNRKDDFKLKITTRKYEELCMDLWKIFLIKIDEISNLAKLKKKKKINNNIIRRIYQEHQK